MPKYKNNTQYPINWGTAFFDAGEEKEVNYFIPEKESGLIKTSDLPVPEPSLLLAQSLVLSANGSETIEVPYCSGRFSLYLITDGTGIATAKWNEKTASITSAFGLSLENLAWDKNARFTLNSVAGATVNIVAVEV